MQIASPHDFVGRRRALDAISQWCGRESPQPLIITGPPGSGKTTLVRVLEQKSKGSADEPATWSGSSVFTYFHYCRANDDRSLVPMRFVERLAKALCDRFPGFIDAVLDDNPELRIVANQTIGFANSSQVNNVVIHQLNLGERSSRAAYDRAVRRPLERLRQLGIVEPVRVAVDALDEALTFDQRRHLVDLLRHALDTADSPSENVRFLLTARRGERRVLDVLDGEEFDLSAQFAGDDIDEYIRRQVGRTGTELSPSQVERLAEQIGRASDGNFLYAHHILAVVDFRDPVLHLPSGLKGLYAEFLERELRPSPLDDTWNAQHWPILSTLAVARGEGLTSDQLSGATGLAPARVQHTLGLCAQFLDRTDADSPIDFYHPSFREYLLGAEDLGITAQRPDRRLSTFLHKEYQAGPDEPSSRYAIAHLHRHLARAIAAERLASERLACQQRLRTAADDAGLLERKTALVGIDMAIADLIAGLEMDDAIRPNVDALDRAAGHLRSWLPEEPSPFAQQVLDAALQKGANSLAMSARSLLASRGNPYLVRRWDTERNGAGPVRRLIGHQWGVASLAALSGNRLASAAYDDSIRIWNYVDGSLLKVIALVAKSPLGAHAPPQIVALPNFQLAVAFENDLLLVHPESGQVESRELNVSARALAVSASGQLLGGVGSAVLAWDCATLERLPSSYTGHTHHVRAICTSPTGATFSADAGGQVHRWHASKPSDGSRFATVTGTVTALTSCDQFLAAGLEDGRIHVWDLDGAGERILCGHRGPVRALTFLQRRSPLAGPEGLLLMSSSDDTTIRLWDPHSGASSGILAGHEGHVQALVELGGSLVASAESQDVILVWDLDTAASAEFELDGAVRSLTIVDERVVAGYENGSLRFLDLDTGRLLTERRAHDGPVRGLAVALDGRLVSAGEDGRVLVWSPGSTVVARKIDVGHGKVTQLVGTADGRVMAATDRGAEAIEIDTGEVTVGVLGSPPVCGLASNGNGWVAVGEERGRQRLLNVLTDEDRYMRRSSDGFFLNAVRSMAITDDELLISDGREDGDPIGRLFVYDIDAEELLGFFPAHSSEVVALAQLRGQLWSACRDRSIRVLDLNSGHVLARLALDRIPRFIAPLADGSGLVVGDMAGCVSRFDLAPLRA